MHTPGPGLGEAEGKVQQELEELGAQFLLHVNKMNQQISDKVYGLQSTWHPILTSRCMAAASFLPSKSWTAFSGTIEGREFWKI